MINKLNNTISSKQPIGVFDSGYGGLTILDELIKSMPEYDFIYLGDNARAPYGTRSFDVIYEYTLQAVEKLFSMGCQLVVLACNTASAKALRTIQQRDLPRLAPNRRVLGVIRPSVEVLGSLSKSKHVGVLGTVGTVRSESYLMEMAKLYPDFIVTQEACPTWVPLVENREFENEGGRYFIKKHIESLMAKDELIDTLILACTHYPILQNEIRKVLPDHIKLISQGNIVASSLIDYLERHPEIDEVCSKQGMLKFYTTESISDFEEKASVFLKRELKAQHIALN
ncbi:glutamate racemase [Ancylomarina salipaludis]|uniref:Glutamate racemase n=1 Tax=Ancylomarina salipaludis TaxID=2501299 RepID=A0A4Q1JPA7_9BACT|nr:glutamate racemase [Ancylomarina salipaludis]RXQ96745.1 glutamate racemase [Ancylomarina salipaludis]